MGPRRDIAQLLDWASFELTPNADPKSERARIRELDVTNHVGRSHDAPAGSAQNAIAGAAFARVPAHMDSPDDACRRLAGLLGSEPMAR